MEGEVAGYDVKTIESGVLSQLYILTLKVSGRTRLQQQPIKIASTVLTQSRFSTPERSAQLRLSC